MTAEPANVETPPAPQISAAELAAAVVACAYLVSPWRVFDIPLFLIGAVALRLSKRAAWPTRPPAWGPTGAIVAATLVSAAALFAYGQSSDVSVMTPRAFALIGVIYAPSAALQQYITQGYLVGRLGRRLGGRSDLVTSLVGGAIFSLAHLPLDGLVLPTFFCGVIWSMAFLRGAHFGSLVFSHALLATLWFLAILGRDPFQALGLV